MSVIVPGDKIPFDAGEKRKLAVHMEEIIGPAMQQHATVRRQTELAWEWYSAKPLVEERSTPFVKASNVIYPLIKMHGDSIQARRFLSLLPASDVWASSSRNEKWAEISRTVVDFINHEADDNAFDLRTPMSDALLEGTIASDGIIALQWGDRVRHRFIPGERRARTVTMNQGPHLLPVPRGQIMWQADRSLSTSEYVIRIAYMTWSDLTRAVRFGGWDADAVKSIRGVDAEQSPVYQSSLSLTDLSPSGPERFRPYEIYECWMEFPLLRGTGIPKFDNDELGAEIPAMVVYVEARTNTILHAMAHPYPISGWPFYQFSYRRSVERGQSRGIAKDLDHMQRAASTMINQAIDAVTLQNAVMGLTSDPQMVGKRFTPGQLQFTQDITATRFDIRPAAIVQPNVQLIQLILATAERVTGMSDPAFGREMRSGGHPSPATSTLALLQQGQTRLARTLAFDRQELSRLGEDLASLYQHFEADAGRIARVIGIGDAQRLQEWLFPTDPTAGRVEFDVRALSDGMNPDAEFQKAVQIDQVVTNFYAKMLQGLNVAVQATQAPPPFGQAILEMTFHSFDAFIASTKRALDAANVDNIEDYLGMLQEAKNAQSPDQLTAALNAAQQAAQLGLEQASSGPQGPAVATGPGGVPAAAPDTYLGAGGAVEPRGSPLG